MARWMTVGLTVLVAILAVGTIMVTSSDSGADADNRIEVSYSNGHLIDVATNTEYTGGTFSERLSLRFIPNPGYEFVTWDVEGDIQYSADSESMTIESVSGNAKITAVSRNYSASTSLFSIIDEQNAMVPGDTMVMNWSFKSADLYMNGGTWLGMPCTPLIVGDVVYVRAGSYLYALDIDSGTVLHAVKSEGLSVNYYHYISYGNGVIFDTTGYKAYDLELNYLYEIPKNLRFVTYYDGYFYGCETASKVGTAQYYTMFKTSLGVDSDLRDGTKTNLFESKDEFLLFAQWGQYSSFLIQNGWAFFLEAAQDDLTDNGYRAITAFNLRTEEHVTLDLTPLIGGMMWDDGWLTYENGYLYLTTYVAGLFDGIREGFEDRNDSIVWVKFNFDKGDFETPHCKDIETPSKNKFKGIASGFVIKDGHGYINARSLGTETGDNGVNDEGTCMISFDIGEDGEPIPKYASTSYMTHGGVVLNTGFEDQGIRYIYIIPYNSANQGVYVFTDRLVDGKWVLDEKFSYIRGDDARQTFCSQGVRVGSNAQFIYYVDSGYLDCYIPVDRFKITTILVEGDYADVRVGYGANAAVVLEDLYAAKFNGSKVTIGDKTYTATGLNEVQGSWSTISDLKKSTFSGKTFDTKAITEAYYRYVILVADGTESRTNNASNSGEKGWYYYDDGHYEKVTVYLPDSLDGAVGKQMFYSLTKPSDGLVVINPNATVKYGTSLNISVPIGAKCSVTDKSIINVEYENGVLSVEGLMEGNTTITVTVNYVDYPIAVEVLPNIVVDEHGNKEIHSSKQNPTDDGGTITVTEDSTSNDAGSHTDRTEIIKDSEGTVLSTKTISIDTKAQDEEALDDNGKPSATSVTITSEYDGGGTLISKITVSTQYSSSRAGDGTLSIYDVKSVHNDLTDENEVTTTSSITRISFKVSTITVEKFEGTTSVSRDVVSKVESAGDSVEITTDNGVANVTISAQEPLDLTKLIETLSSEDSIDKINVKSEVPISSTALVTMAGAGVELTLGSGNSGILLGSEVLQGLSANSGDLSFSVGSNVKMTAKQQSAAGDAKVFSIDLKCGDVEQHDFGKFTLTIACDITLQDGKELKAWRIDDYGKKTYATNVTYSDGKVSFDADHLSIYAIGYESESSESGDSKSDNGGGNGNTLMFAGIGAIAVLALLGAVFMMRRRH